MTGFSADWLTVREPFDAAARDGRLEGMLADWARKLGSLRVIDLGSGTGSNLRHLAPRLPVPQQWTLIEHDPALIAAGTGMLPAGVDAHYLPGDLNRDLEGLLAGGQADLITCSALLDLVSASWLERLVAALRSGGAAFLGVLSYDGRIELVPPQADGPIIELVNRHQTIDKGFGPALGPAAVGRLHHLLTPFGSRCETAPSDWKLGTADVTVQRMLVDGWAGAAGEMHGQDEGDDDIRLWQRMRHHYLDTGRHRARVGHRDLLWLP